MPAPDAYRRRLSEMLDLTYELEGLLHIGVARSSVPPRLNQLIVNKLNAIVALADEPARPEDYLPKEEPIVTSPEPVADIPVESAEPKDSEEPSGYQLEEEMSEPKFETPSEDVKEIEEEVSENISIEETSTSKTAYEEASEEEKAEDSQDEELEIEEESVFKVFNELKNRRAQKIGFADNTEESGEETGEESEIDSVEETPVIPSDAVAEDASQEDDKDALLEIEESIESKIDRVEEIEEDLQPVEENNVVSKDEQPVSTAPEKIIEKGYNEVIEPNKPEAPAGMKPKNGRLFSVNDRFLYARELFGGSLKNFDKSIDEAILLDNYDEAEEYFVSEWGVDAESPTGMRFLATIMKIY